jgi:uncharacterized protein YecT (DUF1311 family)
MIRFTQVTWYSQIFAIMTGMAILCLGFWIGIQIDEEGKYPATELVSSLESTTTLETDTEIPVSSEDGIEAYTIVCSNRYPDDKDKKDWCTNALLSSGTCSPNYEGVVSKGCWGEYVMVLNDVVEYLYEDLSKDLNTHIEEQLSYAAGFDETALKYLKQYHEHWYPMREAECELQEISSYGGTLNTQVILECKASVAKAYIEMLSSVRENVYLE